MPCLLAIHEADNCRPDLMNWTCLVYGAPMLGVVIWWIVDARKWFKGPKINVEHRMLGRNEQLLESSPMDEKSLPGLEGTELVTKYWVDHDRR